MNTKYLAIAVAVIVVIGGLFLLGGNNLTQNDSEPETASSPTPSASAESVVLSEQSTSGENGVATLTEEDGKVMVDIQMTGSPQDVSQPAHIHLGACPTPGEVLHPLTNVLNGESKTTLDVTLEELKSRLPLAINVHKSNDEPQVYTACGDLSL